MAAVLHLPFLATNCYACLRAVVAATPCSTCSQVSKLYPDHQLIRLLEGRCGRLPSCSSWRQVPTWYVGQQTFCLLRALLAAKPFFPCSRHHSAILTITYARVWSGARPLYIDRTSHTLKYSVPILATRSTTYTYLSIYNPCLLLFYQS